MIKYMVATVCGLSLAGSVYMAGWGSVKNSSVSDADCPYCDMGAGAANQPVAMLDAVATAPAASGIDMKNTKCIVQDEDLAGSTRTVEYKGKLYHICCDDCRAAFTKEPVKYVKAFEADPAKFGVK